MSALEDVSAHKVEFWQGDQVVRGTWKAPSTSARRLFVAYWPFDRAPGKVEELTYAFHHLMHDCTSAVFCHEVLTSKALCLDEPALQGEAPIPHECSRVTSEGVQSVEGALEQGCFRTLERRIRHFSLARRWMLPDRLEASSRRGRRR